MIGWISGKVLHVNGHQVLLNAQGVGYEIWASSRLLERLQIGGDAEAVIYTDVKQDSIRLFGFDDQLEKQVFLLLIEVKGVGPRTAAEMLSHIDKRDLLRAISSGSVEELQRIKGVGKKTAERIVVELKDKVGALVVERHTPLTIVSERKKLPVEEAVEAMQALGFVRRDAERAVETAMTQSGLQAAVAAKRPVGAGDIVREALRFV